MGLFFTSCKKEEPTPSIETCIATPFDTGVRQLLVGKWCFYKIAWFQETIGGQQIVSWKDTVDLGKNYHLFIYL